MCALFSKLYYHLAHLHNPRRHGSNSLLHQDAVVFPLFRIPSMRLPLSPELPATIVQTSHAPVKVAFIWPI